jgi:glucose repression mediator protein
MREWEEDREPVNKKQANEDNRVRMEDHRLRRPSTPPRDAYRRNSSEARRFEEQRRMEEQQRRAEEQRRVEDMRRAEEQQRHANEGYHPSEAAHHSQSHPMQGHLPPMQQGPAQMHQGPPQMPQGPSQMQNLIHDGPGPSTQAPKDYPPDERSRMDHAPASHPHPPVMNEPERAARKMDVDEDYDDSGEDDKKAVIPSGSAQSSATAGNKTPTSAGINGMMNTKVEGN